MKTFTVDGKRYRLSKRSYDNVIYLSGPGLITFWAMPSEVTLESPGLREWVVEAVHRIKENRKAASEYVQQRVREGKA